MPRKLLSDVSWQVDESTYREDPALSYSTLAKYERSGFNGLSTLFNRIETPSLTFGSAVDSIITGGQSEFDERFFVADFPDISDTIVKIVKDCFREFSATHSTLESIPDAEIIGRAAIYAYQPNWKPETRAKVIKEKGAEYYNLLYLAGNKTILNSETYGQVIAAVRALKDSESTRWYFQDDNPFDDTIQRFYQLKWKATLHGVNYRSMMDLAIVDHEKKEIHQIDLKTSSHYEWEFFKSFIDFNYMIQARLYTRVLMYNLKNDEYFKNFKVLPYKFIVVNKETLTPLVWEYSDTFATGTLHYGKNNQIECRDPETIGEELKHYLECNPTVPNGIDINGCNNLQNWLKTL